MQINFYKNRNKNMLDRYNEIARVIMNDDKLKKIAKLRNLFATKQEQLVKQESDEEDYILRSPENEFEEAEAKDPFQEAPSVSPEMLDALREAPSISPGMLEELKKAEAKEANAKEALRQAPSISPETRNAIEQLEIE